MALRVMHLVDSLGGGIERFVVDLITNIQCGFEHVVVYRNSNGGASSLRDNVIDMFPLKHAPLLSQYRELGRLRREFGPNVMHAHSATMLMYTLGILLTRSHPVVYTEQGTLQFRSASMSYQMMIRWAIRRSHIVAPTRFAADELCKYAGDRTKLCLIRNGVPLVLKQVRHKLDAGVELLFVGHLLRAKGVEFLISAMKLIRAKNVRLRLLGDGPDRGYLADLVNHLSLQDRVVFQGAVAHTEVLSALGRANIFVFPTLREGLGIALLEAMRAGLPVVASAVGGIPEAVQNGVNGLLVPPHDPPSIARAIDELIANPKFAAELGENAKRTVETEFPLQETTEAYGRLYHSLAEGGST